ncbi:MAG: ATP synthase F1 subunit epsilon [Pseudomonadota bacterium]
MSQGELTVKILSPERILFRGTAKSLGLPGMLGYMTLLPGHAPMVAELDSGVMTLEADGMAAEKLFVTGGFVDVSGEGVTVLADVVEKTAEINIERAKKALGRAEERLTGHKVQGIDVPRALSAKKRAAHRIELAGTTKHLH